MQYRILVVVEETDNNYAAYCPELPGVCTTAKTMEELRDNMREALECHIRGTLEEGIPVESSEGVEAYFETVKVGQ